MPLQNENGNVLWFILIAIVLLGALTMTLNRGGTGVEQSGSREQGIIKASEMMRYAKSIEAGVQQLILYGCSENEISFENSVISGYENTNAPSNNSCHIFDVNGAGLTARDLSSSVIANSKGTFFSSDLDVTDIGTGATELSMLVGISSSLCDEINDENGIGSDIATTIDDWTEFDGSYAGNWLIDGAQATNLIGESTGCLTMDGGEYVFYQILLAR